MRTLKLAIALCLVGGTATAAPVTWLVNGTIVAALNDTSSLPSSPQLGDAFTFAITFETDTPDTYAGEGAGNYPGAVQSAVFTIDGNSSSLSLDGLALAYTYNDIGADYYQLTFMTRSAESGSYPSLAAEFSLWSTSPLAFDSEALPTDPPADLSIYQTSFYMVESRSAGSGQQDPYVFGLANSIVAQSHGVPEPAAATLLAGALAAMALTRRRPRVVKSRT